MCLFGNNDGGNWIWILIIIVSVRSVLLKIDPQKGAERLPANAGSLKFVTFIRLVPKALPFGRR